MHGGLLLPKRRASSGSMFDSEEVVNVLKEENARHLRQATCRALSDALIQQFGMGSPAAYLNRQHGGFDHPEDNDVSRVCSRLCADTLETIARTHCTEDARIRTVADFGAPSLAALRTAIRTVWYTQRDSNMLERLRKSTQTMLTSEMS